MRSIFLCLLASLLALSARRASAQSAPCAPLRDRDTGRILNTCPTGTEQIGGACYRACRSGQARQGTGCAAPCPFFTREEGSGCRPVEYGRGAGYAWQFGDAGNPADESWWRGMFARCEREQGPGNCEKSGTTVYPKCAPGYQPNGCCSCRPTQVKCEELGLSGPAGAACAKNVAPGWSVGKLCGVEDAQVKRLDSVLDPAFYLSKYPDLARAFGADALDAARVHWRDHGIDEGRDASRSFSIGAYLARHPDLQAAFGTRYRAALEHWFTAGQAEKRDARPDGTYMADPRADALDPIWYADFHADLKATFGYKVPLLVKHWLEYGISEKRVPKSPEVWFPKLPPVTGVARPDTTGTP